MNSCHNRESNHARSELLQDISVLGTVHYKLYTALNVLDAHRIGYQLLCKKQNISKYRDKPGKDLAFLLADSPTTNVNINMQNSFGELVILTVQKLKIFEDYYTHIRFRTALN